MKKILGTSDAWSTSRLSHRPSEPAYCIADWRSCWFDLLEHRAKPTERTAVFWLTIKALELIGNFLWRILKTQKWIGEGVVKVWVLYKKENLPMSFQWNWFVCYLSPDIVSDSNFPPPLDLIELHFIKPQCPFFKFLHMHK